MAFSAASPANARDQETPGGFRPLFDGETLDGWWGLGTRDPREWMALGDDALAQMKRDSLADIAAHWQARDGVLFNDGAGLFLTTDEHFGDFELKLEYRTVAGGDSGIYLRGVPQVQIWDTTREGGKWEIGADRGSGGLWNNPPASPGRDPLVRADRPFGEWNHVRVLIVGEYVTVDLNHQRVVDHARLDNYFDRSLPVPRRGPIQLQTHGGEIEWRNINVRDITPTEANRLLLNHNRVLYRSIFDGQTFDGWDGPTDQWAITDGAMHPKPGLGGTVHTTNVFGDFEMRCAFQLPPGGNNGMVVRYPGEGDGAYVAMCELQVLDNTSDKYASLDPRQYHGSAYGQAAAERGYLRDPGEWNVQTVRVVGSTIRVEVNGFRILNTDLATVTERMGDQSRYTGFDRTRGFFGFAGHGDPVMFRDIMIRSLDVPAGPDGEARETRRRP